MSRNVLLSIGVTCAVDLPKLKGAGRSAAAIAQWGEIQGYTTRLITDDTDVLPDASSVTPEKVKITLEELIGDGGQDRILISFAGHGLRRDGAEELWLLNNWRAAPGGINHIALRDRLESYRPKQIGFISDVCRTLPTSEARRVEGSAIISYKEYEETSIQTVTLNGTLAAQPAYSTPMEEEDQYCFFSKVVYDALRGEFSGDSAQLKHNDLVGILREQVPLLVSKYNRTQIPDPKGNFDSPDIWSDLSIDMTSLKAFDLEDRKSEPVIHLGSPRGRSTNRAPKKPPKPNFDNLVQNQFLKLSTQIQLAEDSRWPHLVVAEKTIVSVTTEKGFNLIDRDHPNDAYTSKKGSSLLVELENGDFAGAAMYDNMRTIFVFDEIGVESLTIQSRAFQSRKALELNAKANVGGLFSDPSYIAADIAANLRQYKHANPVMGVQAAYAYATQGATQDIRRTAYFYAKHSQPLPFDIALLGKLKMYFENGYLLAEIPNVEARTPQSEIEENNDYTYMATPPATCRVAGIFPWMRQGWAFVESNRNDFVRHLTRYREELRGSMYTTLTNRAGTELREFIIGI